MKTIFEYLTDSFSLLENPLEDYVVMGVVGVIAYVVAYRIVGSLYRFEMIDGRGIGHLLHWIIRLFIFVITFCVVAIMIRICSWLTHYLIINGG